MIIYVHTCIQYYLFFLSYIYMHTYAYASMFSWQTFSWVQQYQTPFSTCFYVHHWSLLCCITCDTESCLHCSVYMCLYSDRSTWEFVASSAMRWPSYPRRNQIQSTALHNLPPCMVGCPLVEFRNVFPGQNCCLWQLAGWWQFFGREHHSISEHPWHVHGLFAKTLASEK